MLRSALPLVLVTLIAAALIPQAPAAAQGPGTIAYVRAGGTGGDQIRLVEPDGGGDRLLWAAPGPDPRDVYAVSSLAWRPDGRELAFASDHEDGCSVFSSDIYGIGPDGRGYRRLVNTPACGSLAAYPHGSVTVSVRNLTRSPDSSFAVYVQGAPRPVELLILPGATASVSFPAVADLGDLVQLVVVIRGDHRWIVGGVDIVPGASAAPTPPSASIFGEGIPHYGAWYPSWRADGSALGYAQSGGVCVDVRRVPTAPEPPGRLGVPILEADREQPCTLAWAPAGAPADQVLFRADGGFGAGGHGIYRATEGTRTSAARRLATIETGALLLWYDWLPDGSGLIFARTTGFSTISYQAANLFHHDFASGVTQQVTSFGDSFVRSFSVAPDGRTIVFERAGALEAGASELWVVGRDGGGLRMLVADGRLPAWGPPVPAAPPLDFRAYLPHVRR